MNIKSLITNISLFAVGFIIGGLGSYIFYSKKAEEKAINIYEKQVDEFKNREAKKKIVPLEKTKPVKWSQTETDKKEGNYMDYRQLAKSYSSTHDADSKYIYDESEDDDISAKCKDCEYIRYYVNEGIFENDGEIEYDETDEYAEYNPPTMLDVSKLFGIKLVSEIAQMSENMSDGEYIRIYDPETRIRYSIEICYGQSHTKMEYEGG